MPHADVRQLSSSRKVTVVFILVVVAVLAGYPLAIYRLADHPLPLNPLLFIVTVFEATTLIFCVQVLIYGLARSYTARSRRIPVVRLNGPSR